jgi:hypothetical protein
MAIADRIGGRWCPAWPDGRQTLLLRAVLGPPREAAEAFRRWRLMTDLDRVDPGSYRLLPLLWHVLEARGGADGGLGRVRGLFRRTFCMNQVLFAAAGTALRGFEARGIPAMLLKGAALARGTYETPALRPMDDVDLLVPAAAAPEAVASLRSGGWRPDPREAASPEGLFARRAAARFGHPSGGRIDLHWRLYHGSADDGADGAVWADSLPGELCGVPVRYPCPAHLLAHVLVHGLARTPVPRIGWIADAAVLLARTGGRFDWRPFVREAEGRGVAPFLRDALAFLVAEFGAPVPSAVLRRLGRRPEALAVWFDYLARMRPPRALWTLLSLGFPWAWIDALRGAGGKPGGLRGLRRHFAGRWGAALAGGPVFRALGILVRRVGLRLGS